MKNLILFLSLALAGAAFADQAAGGSDVAAYRGDPPAARPALRARSGQPQIFDAKSGFEALKGMAGTWTGVFGEGKGRTEPATVHYEVTSGGSVVKETLFPGTPHEMVTMYHREGDGLVLVHYCAMGNQPKMRLTRVAPARRTLRWEFAGGSNVSPRKDTHMHEASMRFVADGKVESSWTHWKNGSEAGTVTLVIARQ